MKAAFGLVALLVTVAILLYLFTLNTTEVVKQSQPARQEAERIAGYDETGMRVMDSIKLEPMMSNNKLRAMVVDEIVPEGPMAKYYGLKLDDQILAVGPIDFKDNDSGLAEAMVWEARQRNAVLRVRREGREYEVAHVDGNPVWQATGRVAEGVEPEPPTAPQPAVPQPGTATPNETPARDNIKVLTRQLERIPGVQKQSDK